MNHCKLSGKSLVIQLAGDELRVALMVLGAKPRILHGAVYPLPPGAVEDGVLRDPDTVTAILKKRLSEPEFRRTRRAVFTLCTTQVLTETVKTPALPENRLEKLLQSNMDVYFPVSTVDYQLLWETVGTSVDEKGKDILSVQLWAVPRPLLKQYYKLAASCSLTVLAMDYCGHGAALAVGAAFASAEKGKKVHEAVQKEAAPERSAATELHITMEREHLLLTFVQAGKVRLQRIMRCGLDETGTLSEIFMVLEYYRSMDENRQESAVTGLLSGSMAATERLTELEAALGIPVAFYDGSAGLEWMLCLGAARSNLDFGDPTLNRSGRRPRGSGGGTAWQFIPLALGVAAVAVVLKFNATEQAGWDKTIYDLEGQEMALKIQSKQTAGFAQNYYDYLSKYENYSADWDLVFSSLRTYNDNLLLVLEELENTIPATSSVVSMSISAEGMELQFACPDKEEAAYLIMSLRSLQYASLDAVSSLTGGGGGPHNSQTEEGEKDSEIPETGQVTEESTLVMSARVIPEMTVESVKYNAGLADLAQMYLGQSMSQGAMMDKLSSMNPQQLEALEASYGKLPTVSHTMDELVARASEAQRKAAVNDMLKNNPFAAYRFMRLLEQDIYRPAGTEILYGKIRKDLMKSENQMMMLDILSGNIRDAATMQGYLDRLAQMVTKDAETLAATEELIATDPTMTCWYTYYLEVAMGLRAAEDTPYLDQDKMIADALGGGFNTGDPELDKILNGMIPSIPGLGGNTGGTTPGTPGTPSTPGTTTPNIPADIQKEIYDWYMNGCQGELSDAAKEYLAGMGILPGGTGGIPGIPEEPEPVDTRIFFTVSLGYRQNLISAELERKGMLQTEKIGPLEVTE